ncbi:hypothetical protein [Xanthobacter autotrophicus]|uniref:hypothetical protein n=1 Tax=Xanthobacter autotrophicus TaxID=280 RepID=UPI0037279A86
MPKPTAAANATAMPEAPRRLTDAEKLARIHDLESDFYAAENMAGIVWDLLSEMFDSEAKDASEKMTGHKDCFIIDPGALERLHFAVSHSWRLTEKLKDDLLAGLGYGSN